MTALRIALAGTLTTAKLSDTDAAPRVSGVLLTYGDTSAPSLFGDRVRVMPDAVRLPVAGVPLMREHDTAAAAAGVLTALTSEGEQLLGTFDLLDTSSGRDTLAELRAGVRTELSVGLAVESHERDDDGTLVVLDAELVEVSQVLRGAMPGARVTDVAATAATDPEGFTVPDTAPAVEQTGGEVAAPVLLSTLSTLDRPSVGEYLHAMLTRNTDPARFAALAAPHTFVADVPGIIPTEIIGEVLSTRPGTRPLFDALGARPGPAGKSFIRPYISDPLLDAATGTEKSDVTDQLKVTGIEVSYEFLKRAVNISAEAISATSPEVLQVAAGDLATAYLRGCEKVAATELVAADGTPAATANLGAVYAASATMYGATGRQPDILALSPGAWAKVAPTLPVLNVTNGQGTNVGAAEFGLTLAGLRVVVSWAITGTLGYLIASPLVESWERSRIEMRADEPTILGVALGIGGAAAVSVVNDAGVTALELATFA